MSCGTQLPDAAKYCKKCGTPVGLLADEVPPRPALSADSKAILKRSGELLMHAQPKEAMNLLTEAATSDPKLHDNPAYGKMLTAAQHMQANIEQGKLTEGSDLREDVKYLRSMGVGTGPNKVTLGYCVYEKRNVEIQDNKLITLKSDQRLTKSITLKSGERLVRGTCSSCGKPIIRIQKTHPQTGETSIVDLGVGPPSDLIPKTRHSLNPARELDPEPAVHSQPISETSRLSGVGVEKFLAPGEKLIHASSDRVSYADQRRYAYVTNSRVLFFDLEGAGFLGVVKQDRLDEVFLKDIRRLKLVETGVISKHIYLELDEMKLEGPRGPLLDLYRAIQKAKASN